MRESLKRFQALKLERLPGPASKLECVQRREHRQRFEVQPLGIVHDERLQTREGGQPRNVRQMVRPSDQKMLEAVQPSNRTEVRSPNLVQVEGAKFRHRGERIEKGRCHLARPHDFEVAEVTEPRKPTGSASDGDVFRPVGDGCDFLGGRATSGGETEEWAVTSIGAREAGRQVVRKVESVHLFPRKRSLLASERGADLIRAWPFIPVEQRH